MTLKMTFRNSAGKTWSRPVPKHVQVELAACVALDRLKVALTKARTAISAGEDAMAIMVSQPDGAQVYEKWLAANAALQEAFLPVETHGKELIAAVRSMLAV